MTMSRKVICLTVSFTGVILFIVSIIVGVSREAPADEQIGIVTGRILASGGVPLSWGEVMFYEAVGGPPPMPDKYDRTPDYTRSTDADGKFSIKLPQGKYYLGAVKRMSGERFGVPQVGDYALLKTDAKGKLIEYVVKSGSVLDVGVIASAMPIRPQDIAKRAIQTAIAGAIVEPNGTPVEDAVVIAYVDPTVKGKPLFISEKSGKNGKYILRVTGGTYYLRVRNNLTGGPPEPGQIVGYYGEGEPAPVAVKDSEVVKGIDFTVVLFEGRGPRPRPEQ